MVVLLRVSVAVLNGCVTCWRLSVWSARLLRLMCVCVYDVEPVRSNIVLLYRVAR